MTIPAFTYGDYTHDEQQVSFTNVTRTFKRGKTGRKHLMNVRWGIKGRIIRPSITEVWEALANMKSAYEVDGGTAGFGGSPFMIDGQLAIGGTRVVSPISHPKGIQGSQFATYLDWEAELEADFMVAGDSDILEFEETISYTDNDGLPITVERNPLNGTPFRQAVSMTSWYYATQTGRLRCPRSNPPPMSPLFGYDKLRTSGNGRTITTLPAETIQGFAVSFGVQWKYDFISSTPFGYVWPRSL